MGANDLRGYSLTLSASCDLVTETCYSCGILFAMPADHKQRLLKNRNSFYCPNGHAQQYTGKTEAEKLREQLEAKDRELERERSRTAAARAEAQMAENSRRVTKGHLTRIKNRIKHGVCPCCNRQFKNLQRHMENKHPDYVGDIGPGLKAARS